MSDSSHTSSDVNSEATAIDRTLHRARERLLAARNAGGWWEGELSSSALSTATACAALALASADPADPERVASGLSWLAREQNEDGGFGDTTCSPSNLSTTALSWMALGLGSSSEGHLQAKERAEAWLCERLGALDAGSLARGLREVYAEDRTFAVPILVACAIGGCFDQPGSTPAQRKSSWANISRLPYELAALPRELFRWLGLPVVSYALPALIAIGQAIEHHRPSLNPLARALRSWTKEPTLKVLERIQPEGGGFLEATPLTSFVVLSLISCGRCDHPVSRRGLEFLRRSIRSDGSWPIDTNLATWLTTLAIGALGSEAQERESLEPLDKAGRWILDQQHLVTHPYTGAAPGGWAWTDLPGGVPDADDTSGAILALFTLDASPAARWNGAAEAGALWLCGLQNADGGIPTFCRGWGKLPFDRSCPDITAHALRAWDACMDRWIGVEREQTVSRLRVSMLRARGYLVASQRDDGSWLPLWFGNQEHTQQLNPVYGTSRVLRAASVAGDEGWRRALARGLGWLLSVQNEDGGFGGGAELPSSVEETALALEALVDSVSAGLGSKEELRSSVERAASFLVKSTAEGTRFDSRPIGLYFARLWYSERLYPLIFSVSALERARRLIGSEEEIHPYAQPLSAGGIA